MGQKDLVKLNQSKILAKQKEPKESFFLNFARIVVINLFRDANKHTYILRSFMKSQAEP